MEWCPPPPHARILAADQRCLFDNAGILGQEPDAYSKPRRAGAGANLDPPVSFTLKLVLIFVSSGSVVTGQALLSLISRKLYWPIAWPELARLIIQNPLSYACVLSYAVGVIAYATLLKYFPLAQINITLMVVMITITLGYTHMLGQTLTGTQWIGAVLAAIGLIALNSR